MFWLIQKRFSNEAKTQELLNNLNRLGIGHSLASVKAFDFNGDIEIESTTVAALQKQSVFVYGSYTMANIAARIFTPGAFVNPELNMVTLQKHYGQKMLNHDMIVGKVKDITPTTPAFFVRPVEDTKAIVGAKYTLTEYLEWKTTILRLDEEDPVNYAEVTPDTMICIASCKSIDAEYRCFVVNGKVAAASQYKLNQQPFFSAHVDQYIIDYVHSITKIWQPAKAFVLDIALANDRLFVIEANCINSSGLYEADTQKLIMAIEDLT